MRIVIDLQGAQTEKNGCYSLDLALAIARIRGEHAVSIALNGSLAESIEPIRAAFYEVLPQENIRVWQSPGSVRQIDAGNDARRKAAELVREAFLASLNPDIVLVTNLFDGLQNESVASIGTLSLTVPTAVLLQNAIPEIESHSDFERFAFEAWKQNKSDHLRRANLILVTSESTLQTCTGELGFPPEKVVWLDAVKKNRTNYQDLIAQQGMGALAPVQVKEHAEQIIPALDRIHTDSKISAFAVCLPPVRPKLAYLSPLPPERSGISDYSLELLQELTRHYEIDLVVVQDEITDPWLRANCRSRSVEWFRSNTGHYDRVLYHLGNSAFHQHMFGLLEEIPGIVVLHDFFLSNVVAHMSLTGVAPGGWLQELYHAHGYGAAEDYFHSVNQADVAWRYPCNLNVLQKATGVIVHSESSRRLAKEWYGVDAANDWKVIPLLRQPASEVDSKTVRQRLKLGEDDFVVCSFGMLFPHKLNDRLIKAWLASSLAKNEKCVLVFVGENPAGEYGEQILSLMRPSGVDCRIHITGWVEVTTYRDYLAAADVGVQLRSMSRGETSAAALDCMNYGVATLVNANGSMADLPDDCVLKIPDEFTDLELVGALESLWADTVGRQMLGMRARESVHHYHSPIACANQYAEFIERRYRLASAGLPALISSLAQVEKLALAQPPYLIELSENIALSIPPRMKVRQLFVDVSAMVNEDLKTGIQRVVRSILRELLTNPPAGYRIEPVFATAEPGYRYARRFALQFMNCPEWALDDEPIDFQAGDIFLGLDLAFYVIKSQADFYQKLRRYGVNVHFVVYDMLPILLPHAFPAGTAEQFEEWLNVVTASDGAVCISRAVGEELSEWIEANQRARLRPYVINWFHLGADIEASKPTGGISSDAEKILREIRGRTSYLMVGTVEPRKGHAQALAAFEALWSAGEEVNLVIVGKLGWKMDALAKRLRAHSQLGKRLFWLEGISDEYLEEIYASSSCLLAASEGEGFGLPLVEAAQHGLPIVARDIPVFREVAGQHAHYFNGIEPAALAEALKEWLALFEAGNHPKPQGMAWFTWKQSSQQLLSRIIPGSEEKQHISTPGYGLKLGTRR